MVGGEELSEEDLQRFEAAVQSAPRAAPEGIEGHREHLQSLIDIKLMAMEAEARGHGRDPALRAALEAVERLAAIETYLRVRLGQDVPITEAELWETFKSHPASQAVRVARILVATREEAEAAHAELQAGRPFEEVARARSLDRQTAEKGGDLGRYYAFDEISDQIFARIFALEVGAVSAPFRTPQGYEIGKVLDKRQVDFEQYRPIVQRVAVMDKFVRRRREHLAALEEALALRLGEEGLKKLLGAWNQCPGYPELSPEELEGPLYTFTGGQLTLQQAVNVLVRTGQAYSPLDSAGLDQRLRQQVVPDFLLWAAAQRAGFAEHPEVQRRVREEREKRLVKALWEEELEKQVEATLEEARAHYDAHPEFYRAPEEITVQEILVPTLAQAERLRAQIRGGADMGELAARHSIRLHAEQNGGRYSIRSFERLIYRELADAVRAAPTGQVQGPLEITRPPAAALKGAEGVDRAFSIFRVEERRPEGLRSFEETAQLSFFYARQQKQQRRLQELIEGLRRAYRWSIDGEALSRYVLATAHS
ncbi:MAG: peptidylprolyl isomerase [Candidatus Latescibacteria bacterium]|nr:peptidylprolyl isomerase [Candidatus Latescibacterota bacterium]